MSKSFAETAESITQRLVEYSLWGLLVALAVYQLVEIASVALSGTTDIGLLQNYVWTAFLVTMGVASYGVSYRVQRPVVVYAVTFQVVLTSVFAIGVGIVTVAPVFADVIATGILVLVAWLGGIAAWRGSQAVLTGWFDANQYLLTDTPTRETRMRGDGGSSVIERLVIPVLLLAFCMTAYWVFMLNGRFAGVDVYNMGTFSEDAFLLVGVLAVMGVSGLVVVQWLTEQIVYWLHRRVAAEGAFMQMRMSAMQLRGSGVLCVWVWVFGSLAIEFAAASGLFT